MLVKEEFEIGRGGLATVYKTRFRKQDVAAKILRNRHDVLAEQAASDRKDLQKEAELLHGLNHPNVIKVKAILQCDNIIVGYLMELLGPCLRIRLQSRKLGPSELHQALRNTCQGAAYLHRNLISHNDLNCNNLVKCGLSWLKRFLVSFCVFECF